MTFTKLFSSITASTMWLEPSDTRVVWITMLAMADRRGRVFASVPGLAKEAVVPVESCREALDRFLSPDPDSRTKVADGRRIEPIDGGWRLINHAKYRAIRDEEERRAYKTEKQREYRCVDNVDKSGQCGPQSTTVDSRGHNAEAEAEAEAKRQKQKRAPSALTIPEWIPDDAWQGFLEVRKRLRAPNTDRALTGIIRELENLRARGFEPGKVLDQSTTRGWRGVFEIKNGGSNGSESKSQRGATNGDDRPRVKTGSAFFDSLLEPIVDGD